MPSNYAYYLGILTHILQNRREVQSTVQGIENRLCNIGSTSALSSEGTLQSSNSDRKLGRFNGYDASVIAEVADVK